MKVAASALIALLLGPTPLARADETAVSPGAAAWISVGSTLGGAGAGLGLLWLGSTFSASQQRGPHLFFGALGGTVYGASLVIGPSVGRWAGGAHNSALGWIGSRIAIAGLGLAIALAQDNNSDGGLGAGLLVVGLTAIAFAGDAIVDVATTPGALRARRGLAWTLVPTMVAQKPGLALVRAF
jgi:hypothetical protein